MNLQTFYRTIAPCLQDPSATAAVAAALYPEAPTGLDARRLAIYAGHTQRARQKTLSLVYPRVQRLFTPKEDGWRGLCAAFFHQYPTRSWTLHENGRDFPAFLRGLDIPQWQVELADLEWWAWVTRIAPDAPEDADDRGPLRLAATTELRYYEHAVLDFWEQEEEPPAARPQWVLFYRDRALERQIQLAAPLTLALLKAVHEGLELSALAGLLGRSPESVQNAASILHRDGLLRGTFLFDRGTPISDRG